MANFQAEIFNLQNQLWKIQERGGTPKVEWQSKANTQKQKYPDDSTFVINGMSLEDY